MLNEKFQLRPLKEWFDSLKAKETVERWTDVATKFTESFEGFMKSCMDLETMTELGRASNELNTVQEEMRRIHDFIRDNYKADEGISPFEAELMSKYDLTTGHFAAANHLFEAIQEINKIIGAVDLENEDHKAYYAGVIEKVREDIENAFVKNSDKMRESMDICAQYLGYSLSPEKANELYGRNLDDGLVIRFNEEMYPDFLRNSELCRELMGMDSD